jgi:hypothetical protein
MRPLLPPSKVVKKLKELVGLEFDRSGGNHDIYKTPSGKKFQSHDIRAIWERASCGKF